MPGACLAVLLFVGTQATLQANDQPAQTAADDPLVKLVDEAIEITKKRHLDFQQHTPWQILHGLLALRENYVLKDGDQMVNAIEWISNKGTFRGQHWFQATPHGAKAHPYNGTPYDFEGHVNQTLAIIAMCNLPLDHEFKVAGGQTVTMTDMINHAKMTVNSQEEITWTLWFLTHYVDQDEQWTNIHRQPWSMETLVRMQSRFDPNRSPCGGCHGLFAMAYARNAYLQKHGQLRGAWLEADQRLQQYVAAARAMQNRDGSFATEFFRARGFSYEFNERIKSSGHMIEWLMMALPRRQLDDQWVRLGVQTLANDLIRNASQPADCGPLYHALHALVLYKQRVQPQSTPGTTPAELAAKPADEVTATKPEATLTVPTAPAPTEATSETPPVLSTKPELSLPATTPAETPKVVPLPASPQVTVTVPSPYDDGAAPTKGGAQLPAHPSPLMPIIKPNAGEKVAESSRADVPQVTRKPATTETETVGTDTNPPTQVQKPTLKVTLPTGAMPILKLADEDSKTTSDK